MKLPPTTIVNRFVPKEKFYTKTSVNTKLRELFTNEIEKIVWTHKIASSTLSITAGDYAEMQIFEISLKLSDLDPQVIRHIDAFIPYPILFILKKPGVMKLVISYKEPLSTKTNVMKVSAYFETSWQPEFDLELKGRSVDEIYKNYLHQIAPNLELNPQSDVKSAVEISQNRDKIIKQIDSLNRAILHEPSIAKQQEMARERFSLEQQL